ncbi:MAG: hypothetical protein KF862_17560 [Chitinophagaceae bacterium]|nr:hypothetical protein [Chitinophagaceae bacterium]
MRSLSYKTLTLILYVVCVYSCKKGDTDTFVPPVDTLSVLPLAPPPSSISYENADFSNGFTLSFDYASGANRINVYIDDTTNDDPYDELAVSYFFNNGYLEKTEYYSAGGAPAGSFTIQRSGTTINRLIIEHTNELNGGLIKDSFGVSFADSAGLTNMYVNYGNYFSPQVPVSVKYTFKNNLLKEVKAGLYEHEANTLFFPSYKFSYNKSDGRLWLKESDSYYGTSFTYGDVGKGIDSLFFILGGKDGHLVDAILYFDQNIGLYFYPIQMALFDNSVELDALIHRYGALQLVQSIPNGDEYPVTQSFSFQNVFDEEKKLIKSTILSNSLMYGSFTIRY